MAWRDPVVGGVWLIRKAIQSINFVTGLAGWQINQDGTVEFNSGTFRGTVKAGSFVGTDFVINTNGEFSYSGTPGPNTLSAFVVPAPAFVIGATVSDGNGNAALAGVTTYEEIGVGIYGALNICNGQVTAFSASSMAGPWTQQSVIQVSPINSDSSINLAPNSANGAGVTVAGPLFANGNVNVGSGLECILPTGVAATDTAAINSAMASGVPVRLVAGTYNLNSPIALKSGSWIEGSGSNTVIVQQTAGVNGFTGTDISNVHLAGFYLQGQGITGPGNGIAINASSHPNVAYVSLRDITVAGFGNIGVQLGSAIVSHLSRVIVTANFGSGFQVYEAVAGGTPTSLVFDACYANANGLGFELDSVMYTTLNGCASDHQGTNYFMTGCQGVTLNGIGSESFTAAGLEMSNCQSCEVHGIRTFNGTPSHAHVWITGSSTRCTVSGAVNGGGTASGTFLEVDAGSSCVAWGITRGALSDVLSGTVTNVDGSA